MKQSSDQDNETVHAPNQAIGIFVQKTVNSATKSISIVDVKVTKKYSSLQTSSDTGHWRVNYGRN
jgi:hypothetical protein